MLLLFIAFVVVVVVDHLRFCFHSIIELAIVEFTIFNKNGAKLKLIFKIL